MRGRGRVDARKLATRLAPTFEKLAADFRQDEQVEESRRDQAQGHVAAATELEGAAKKFLKLLDKFRRRRIPDALARGYLPRGYPSTNSSSSDRPPQLADVLGVWTAEAMTRASLAELVRDCELWRVQAQSITRRPGRPVGNRRLIAEMAALHLERADVTLAKSRRGVFTHVVIVLYEAAGLSGADAYRDVCAVLDYPKFRQYVRYRPRGTQSRSKTSK